jgi:hypothetical protein
MPSITLGLAFTDDELTRAILLMQNDPENFHVRCRDEIVMPAMDRINAALQQENDPDWIAYFLEYALTRTRDLITTTESQDESNRNESQSG